MKKPINITLELKGDELKDKLKIKDGYTPVKGVDYFDGKPGKDAQPVDINEVADKASQIVTNRVKSLIPKPIDVPKVLYENIQKYIEPINYSIESIHNEVLKLDEKIGSRTGATGFKAFRNLTDAPHSYKGLGGRSLRINIAETGIDTYTPTDTDEKVKLSASDPTAGYLDDKISEGAYNVSIFTNDAGYLTAETDTLSSVTGRGASTSTESTFSGGLISTQLKAHTSAGLALKADNGDTAVLIGAGGGKNATFYDGVKLDAGTASRVLVTDASKNISYATMTASDLDAIPTTYAKLDGSNQPFTGDITVSKSNALVKVTDTGLSSSAWLAKDTTLDGSRLVSQGRLYSLPNSLTLAGATYGSGLSYTSTGALSISFWWKTSNAGDSYFIGSSTASSDFRWGSGVLSFGDEAAGLARYWSATGFNNNTWRMITLTISADRATVLCYVNGTLATQTQAGTVGGNFIINRIFATNGKTTGSFDDFKIYTKTLSAAEVTALYNAGAPSEITDMTSVYAYYKLNASSGTSVADSSGNSRTVTLVGGTPVWETGIVASTPNSLSDIPVLRIANNATNSSYGTLTLGYYETSRGTSNIYEGLSHQWNALGTSKMTLTSSGVNISQYTGNLAVGSALSAGTTIAAGTTVSAGTYFLGSAGAVGTPTYSFTGDPNTGAYSGGADIYNIATGGVLRYSIDASGNHAWGAATNSAIFARYSKAQTQLTTASTVAQYEGTHTQNADNSFGWAGSVNSVGLNTAGFNNTAAISSGGALSGGYSLVQLSSTPATGTTTAIVGYRTSVRNTGAATLTNGISFLALPVLNSGAGSVTNAFGFYSSALTVGTNNYDFYGLTAAATGRWGFYQAGGAQNYMLGKLGLGTGMTVPSEQLEIADAGNIKFQTTTGTKIGTATGQKIGFWNATPVIQQVTNAYTSDAEGSAYTGIDNLQLGTPYAQVSDLNLLRVAYETLRASYDDLLTKLKNTGIVA